MQAGPWDWGGKGEDPVIGTKTWAKEKGSSVLQGMKGEGVNVKSRDVSEQGHGAPWEISGIGKEG